MGIETKQRTKEPSARLREFENRHFAPRARHAGNFRQAQVSVRDVSQTEGDGRDLKLAVRERQLLGVRLQEANAVSCLSAAGLLLSSNEHIMTQIRADNRRPASRGPIISEC